MAVLFRELTEEEQAQFDEKKLRARVLVVASDELGEFSIDYLKRRCGTDIYESNGHFIAVCREGVVPDAMLEGAKTLTDAVCAVVAAYSEGGLSVIVVDENYAPLVV